ncbi:hypothetical protein ccbrp13_48040 [Ktedonobacteria bacterium brp13]|nr:hypothetical protein ccbrp13_48040 [Ktedonobacteria bacterium brp13]
MGYDHRIYTKFDTKFDTKTMRFHCTSSHMIRQEKSAYKLGDRHNTDIALPLIYVLYSIHEYLSAEILY